VPTISTLGGFTATFRYFPSGTWNVYVVQGGTSYSAGTASPNATPYSKSFVTPVGVLVGQSDRVKACMGTLCYYSGYDAVTLT
jgi:hypothetical protein